MHEDRTRIAQIHCATSPDQASKGAAALSGTDPTQILLRDSNMQHKTQESVASASSIGDSEELQCAEASSAGLLEAQANKSELHPGSNGQHAGGIHQSALDSAPPQHNAHHLLACPCLEGSVATGKESEADTEGCSPTLQLQSNIKHVIASGRAREGCRRPVHPAHPLYMQMAHSR